jgi:hypothetical protein
VTHKQLETVVAMGGGQVPGVPEAGEHATKKKATKAVSKRKR